MAKYWEDIMDRVSVEEAILRYTGERPNRSHFVCCPLHREKTPSLSVKDRVWHCFGCGQGGNVINFVMKLFNLDFKQACIRLNDDFQLRLPINYNDLSEDQKNEIKEARRKEFIERKRREDFLKWKEEYLNKSISNRANIINDLKEYDQLFYIDPSNPYKTDPPLQTVVGGIELHLPIPYHNFNNAMLDDEDFQQHAMNYIALVKKLEYINERLTPSDKQLEMVYNSRKSRFYINK